MTAHPIPPIPDYGRWFPEARFGLFLHWGPYALYGRGEQVLNREWLEPRAYIQTACRWNPGHYDPATWASVAREAGMRYAVLTARHHDGYCLWETRTTDYSSAAQAPKRDFVREYVEAFRAAGLRVGIYYSLLDLRLPAWLRGPNGDPAGWPTIKRYLFEQVRELMTGYGPLDILWFDGLWPRRPEELDSRGLLAMIRALQPSILVNDRLEWPQYSWYWQFPEWEKRYSGEFLGDFGTPELGIYADPRFLWESCQTSVRRLWGYARGEWWRTEEELLTLLITCALKGGNLLLNVGPMADGSLPEEFIVRARALGAWLERHGEVIYGNGEGGVTEFITRGWQQVKGNVLYLIIRFWDGEPTLRLRGLRTRVRNAVLLTTGTELSVRQEGNDLILGGLPAERPSPLFPVIRVVCEGRPEPDEWGRARTWQADPEIFARWAESRGSSVWADGLPRDGKLAPV